MPAIKFDLPQKKNEDLGSKNNMTVTKRRKKNSTRILEKEISRANLSSLIEDWFRRGPLTLIKSKEEVVGFTLLPKEEHFFIKFLLRSNTD